MSDKIVQLFNDSSSPVFQRIEKIDKNGEVISESFYKIHHENGRGFVISYTEKMCDFLAKVSTGSIVRVFCYLAHHQSYGNDGQFGYRCSHKHLRTILNISKPTLWEALKYLQGAFLVNVANIDGSTEFMVNPNYVTIGQSKKARMAEWNRRWEEHWKHIHQLRSDSLDSKMIEGVVTPV